MNAKINDQKVVLTNQSGISQIPTIKHNVPEQQTDRPIANQPNNNTFEIAQAPRPNIRTTEVADNSRTENEDSSTKSEESPVKIDENILSKELQIKNPKELILNLVEKGYLLNGEPTDDFARLAGPEEFDIYVAFADQKDKIYYLLQEVYIKNARLIGKKNVEATRESLQRTLDSWWRRNLLFRDSMLMRYFELAKCYYLQQNYDKAVETAENIREFQYIINTRKPLYYHEATFLIANSYYKKGLEIYNRAKNEQDIQIGKEYLRKGIGILHQEYSGSAKLNPYRRAYTSELLEMCSNYFELTGEEPSYDYTILNETKHVSLDMNEIAKIYEDSVNANASHRKDDPIGMLYYKTDHFGKRFMRYFDYFIAAKTRINYARYCSTYEKVFNQSIPKEIPDPNTAIKETFDLVDEVKSASKLNLDKMIFFHKGFIDTVIDIWNGKQNEFVNAFGLYSAKAHRIKALRYSMADNSQKALEEIEKAFNEICTKKNECGSSFYLGEWEIKQTFFDILSDYLEILMSTKNKDEQMIKDNLIKAAEISKKLLADKTLVKTILEENPRLYTKLLTVAENFDSSKTDATSVAEKVQIERLSPWDFHDVALSDKFGLINIWMRNKSPKVWAKTAENLLNVIKNPNDIFVAENDMNILSARSFEWLGNLLKWSKENQTDKLVKQKIIDFAANYESQSFKTIFESISKTKEVAIAFLYLKALEKFGKIPNKPLYLEAEEAITKFQLADLVKRILDGTSDKNMKLFASSLYENYNAKMEIAEKIIAEVINKASAQGNEAIKNNVIISYASWIAQEDIAPALSKGDLKNASRIAKEKFTINDDGSITIRTLKTKDSKGQEIEVKLPNDIETIPLKLLLANAIISDESQEDEIIRKNLKQLIDNAQKLLENKYQDLTKAPDEIISQIADITALRIYIEMSKGIDFSLDEVNKLIDYDNNEVYIKTKENKKLVITDLLMQQKLQLALIDSWIKTNSLDEDKKKISLNWIEKILRNPKSDALKQTANNINSFLK